MSKAAGIRVFTALALAAAAALVVFGCGGDSGAETASAPATKTASGAPQSSEKKSSAGQDSKASKSQQAQDEADAEEAAAASQPSAAAKPGAAITPPKGPREPEATPKERSEATVVSMSLTSPALTPGAESVSPLPATYTCEGKDTWPMLQWSAVPQGTAELVLFAINLEPVNEALFFDWAVAGLDPSLTEISSGELPKGAVVGRNSFGKNGYSICPAKSPETVIFALYALPKALRSSKGFDPAALRKEVLEISANAGLLATSYSKG
jgi:phosphatidylethanolamine-binding protein (PEBP) family uncharacterized protein